MNEMMQIPTQKWKAKKYFFKRRLTFYFSENPGADPKLNLTNKEEKQRSWAGSKGVVTKTSFCKMGIKMA